MMRTHENGTIAEAKPLAGQTMNGMASALLREALWNDTGAAVLMLDRDGALLDANPEARELFGGIDPDAGASLSDLLPGRVGSERLDLVRLAIEHAKPIKVEGLIGGLHCLATVRPIDDRCVLMTLRQCAPSVEGAETTGDGGAHLLRARHDDAGPLSQLTAREIDVLRHIGMGMSTAAIAQALHRSVKTIEWHRVSLGNKLGITNRVELARIAIASGLSPVRPLTAGKSDRAEPAPAGETG